MYTLFPFVLGCALCQLIYEIYKHYTKMNDVYLNLSALATSMCLILLFFYLYEVL
jgi:hypothetical protein